MIYSLSMHQLLARCQGKLEPGREGRARCQGAETRPALLRLSVAVPSTAQLDLAGPQAGSQQAQNHFLVNG